MKCLRLCTAMLAVLALCYTAHAKDFIAKPPPGAKQKEESAKLKLPGFEELQIAPQIEELSISDGKGGSASFIRFAGFDEEKDAPKFDYISSSIAPERDWGYSDDGRAIIPIDHTYTAERDLDLPDWDESIESATLENGQSAQIIQVAFGRGNYGGFSRSGGFGGARGISRTFSRPAYSGRSFVYSGGGRSGWSGSRSGSGTWSPNNWIASSGSRGWSGSGIGSTPGRYNGISFGNPLTPQSHPPMTGKPPILYNRPRYVSRNVFQNQRYSYVNRSVSGSYNTSVYAPTNYSYRGGSNFALALPLLGGFGGGGYCGGGGFGGCVSGCGYGPGAYSYSGSGYYNQGYYQQPVQPVGTGVTQNTCPQGNCQPCPDSQWEINISGGYIQIKVNGDVYQLIRAEKVQVQPSQGGSQSPETDAPSALMEQAAPAPKSPAQTQPLPKSQEVQPSQGGSQSPKTDAPSALKVQAAPAPKSPAPTQHLPKSQDDGGIRV